MKKLSAILPILIMLIVSGACVGAYYVFYKNLTAKENVVIAESGETTFTTEEYPNIGTVYAMESLMNTYYTAFTSSEEVSNIYSGDSTDIFYKLINNEIDIAILPALTESQLTEATNAGITLTTVEISKDAMIFITDSSNQVTNLSIEGLKKIYSGEITNWSEVQGTDLEIVAYQKPSGSFIQKLMEQNIMTDGYELMENKTENIVSR